MYTKINRTDYSLPHNIHNNLAALFKNRLAIYDTPPDYPSGVFDEENTNSTVEEKIGNFTSIQSSNITSF